MVGQATTVPEAGEAGNAKAQQILAAARQVFLEQGYGSASMDVIARTAGVSKATLYAHFTGKDALFAAMVGVECRRMSAVLDRPSFDETDIRAALRQIAGHFIGQLLTGRTLAIYRIVVAETPRFPELGRIFFEMGPDRLLARVAEFLRQAGERGMLAVPEPRRAAAQFIGMVRGEIYLRRLFGIEPAAAEGEIDAFVDSCVELFLGHYGRG